MLIADKDDPELPVALEAAKEMAASCRPTIVITDAEETLFPAGAEVFVIPTSELQCSSRLMRGNWYYPHTSAVLMPTLGFRLIFIIFI